MSLKDAHAEGLHALQGLPSAAMTKPGRDNHRRARHRSPRRFPTFHNPQPFASMGAPRRTPSVEFIILDTSAQGIYY